MTPCKRCGHEVRMIDAPQNEPYYKLRDDHTRDECIANLRADLTTASKALEAERRAHHEQTLRRDETVAMADQLHQELTATRQELKAERSSHDVTGKELGHALQRALHAEVQAAVLRGALEGLVPLGYTFTDRPDVTTSPCWCRSGGSGHKDYCQHARQALATAAGGDLLAAVQQLVDAANLAAVLLEGFHPAVPLAAGECDAPAIRAEALRAALANPALASLHKGQAQK